MALQVTGAASRPLDRRQGAHRWQKAGDLLWVPLGAAEARPLLAFALVGLVCVGAYLAGVLVFPSRSGRIINGDAIQYFAYLQSAVVDGDLDFSNDYRQLYLEAESAEGRGPQPDADRTRAEHDVGGSGHPLVALLRGHAIRSWSDRHRRAQSRVCSRPASVWRESSTPRSGRG